MGAKILYIEDNETNRLLVRRILMVEDFDVIEAPDGPTGLEILKTESPLPELILMDMNLPDVDGYEMTRRIRNDSTFDHIPIIAMTANVMMGDREKTLHAGCDGYIPKPIDVDDLPRQLEKFLQIKR